MSNQKKRYTVILRGDIRVEVESANKMWVPGGPKRDLIVEFEMGVRNKWDVLDTGEGFSFLMSELVAILESGAIAAPVYDAIVVDEEKEQQAGEQDRKERGE